ncbi:SpoIIE family protein phosphatase [Streptacidiphilus fuscans]|nr:SpoIIE family protein phosphatase [Streptacidiphilus fuscans]
MPDEPRRSLAERAFEQSPVPWMLCDATGRLLRINAKMSELGGMSDSGLTDEDLRGRLPSELPLPHIDRSVLEESERLIREVAATGEPITLETYAPRPGESRTGAWAVSYTPVRDADGRLDAVAVSAVEFSEQFAARRRQALLDAAGARIGTSLDVSRTAQDLADVVVPGFADFVSVDLLDGVFRGEEPAAGPPAGDVRLRRAAQAGVGPHLAGLDTGVVGVGLRGSYPPGSPPARCLATGRAGVHTMTDADVVAWLAGDPARSAWAAEHGLASLMTVPVTARETTLGVVVFSRLNDPANHRTRRTGRTVRHDPAAPTSEPFHEDDVPLAEEIVGRAAVWLDNARRYTRERATALTLQHSLLQQRAPRQAAVDVASRYLPASAQAGVGGDWFDVIPLSGTRVALVVGDVTGHGLHASATMGRLRTAVRTLADVDLPPDELLSHLDDLVISLNTENAEAEAEAEAHPDEVDASGGDEASSTDGGSAEIGATCLYAVYDPIARRCVLARAGHPEPALRTPDGRVEYLDVPAGPPLGLGGLAFESAEFELPPGSLLALFTDGLVESRFRDPDQGLAALSDQLAAAGPDPDLAAVCDDVLGALTTLRPRDDVALLLARTRALGADQVADWSVPFDPTFVAEARGLAARQLAHWGLPELTFVTELVVSELVTNAIRYGRPPVRLRLIRDTALICEVSDASGTAPHLRRARSFEEGGRGLMLVAQCSTRWGTRHSPQGKTIWAEQALPTGSPAPGTASAAPA